MNKMLEPVLKFLSRVAKRLEVPAAEIFVHLVVTVLSVLSIAAIEWLLRIAGIDGKKIPGTSIPLGDWMFILEIVAATCIIIIGMIKALRASWEEPSTP